MTVSVHLEHRLWPFLPVVKRSKDEIHARSQMFWGTLSSKKIPRRGPSPFQQQYAKPFPSHFHSICGNFSSAVQYNLPGPHEP